MSQITPSVDMADIINLAVERGMTPLRAGLAHLTYVATFAVMPEVTYLSQTMGTKFSAVAHEFDGSIATAHDFIVSLPLQLAGIVNDMAERGLIDPAQAQKD